MGELTYCEKVRAWFSNSKSFLLILSLQFGSAGMYVITMDALKKGMSHYVFVVYRNVVATVAIGPFALFLERFPSPLTHAFIINISHACMMHVQHTYMYFSSATFIMNWTLLIFQLAFRCYDLWLVLINVTNALLQAFIFIFFRTIVFIYHNK